MNTSQRFRPQLFALEPREVPSYGALDPAHPVALETEPNVLVQPIDDPAGDPASPAEPDAPFDSDAAADLLQTGVAVVETLLAAWVEATEVNHADDDKKDTAAYWKAEADKRIDITGVIPEALKNESMTQGILRNTRITAAYAEFASRDTKTAFQYLWMGGAAFASRDVGKAMREAQEKYKDAKRAGDTALMAFYNAQFDFLAVGNKAVYEDMYWQHLAFKDGGIELMRKLKANGDITAEHLKGWEKIASGSAKLDGGDPKVAEAGLAEVAEGNVILFHYEQKEVLQKLVFGPAGAAIDLARAVPGIRVAVEAYLNYLNSSLRAINAKAAAPLGGQSFAEWAKEQKLAHPNVTKFDQRFKWGVEVVLKGYLDLFIAEKEDFLKRFEALLTAEKDLLKAK